ncbi:MAG: hypothetical protein A4E67_01724 [Syntrophaceae bacterium PtaB.Bin038]|nr:MAG: hypothetical protein A4E67_01724 [Syntrophaceae bacterium PtaB.Bin038]
MVGLRVRHGGDDPAEVLVREGLHGPVDRLAVHLPVMLVGPQGGPLHDHAHDDAFPVGGIEAGDGLVALPELLERVDAGTLVGGKPPGELHLETVADEPLAQLEEVGVRRGPGAEELRIVLDAVGALERRHDRGRQHLHENVLCAVLLEPQQFRRQVHGLGREFLDGDDVDVVGLCVFPAGLVDGASVGVVVGEEPHFRGLAPPVNGLDVLEHGGAVEPVAPEGKEHVVDRFLQQLPARGVVDRGDLVALDERLCRQPLAGPPGEDHVDPVLDGELLDRRDGLRHLVARVDEDQVQGAPPDAALDLVDVTQVVLRPPRVVLAPGGCRAGEVDGRSHLDGHCRRGRHGQRHQRRRHKPRHDVRDRSLHRAFLP